MKNKIWKLFFLLLIPLVFIGCSGGEEETPTAEDPTALAGKKVYETTDFSVTIPSEWEIIEKANFTSNVPPETVVAFRSNIKSDAFTANVNVAAKTLEEGVTLDDFAKGNYKNAQNSLVEFTEVLSDKQTISNVEVYISEYEGKLSPADSIVHFRQLALVDGNTGYLITGGFLPNEDETVVKNVDEMLNSFRLK